MKPLLIAIVFVLMIGVVYALPICEESIQINTNCTMITPPLNCSSYNYDILDNNGTIIRSGNLSGFNGNNYYLNFTEGQGQYVVKACDESTRYVEVGPQEDNNMIFFAIIILPMVLAFAFLYWSTQISEEHYLLKLFMQFMIFPLFWASIYLSITIVGIFYSIPAINEAIAYITENSVWVFYGLLVYIAIFTIIKIVQKIMQQKIDNQQRKYG